MTVLRSPNPQSDMFDLKNSTGQQNYTARYNFVLFNSICFIQSMAMSRKSIHGVVQSQQLGLSSHPRGFFASDGWRGSPGINLCEVVSVDSASPRLLTTIVNNESSCHDSTAPSITMTWTCHMYKPVLFHDALFALKNKRTSD